MPEQLVEILNKILIFDLTFIVITILSLIKCTSKGFVLSLLSAGKWLMTKKPGLYSMRDLMNFR